MRKALITGLAGTKLLDAEAAFLRQTRPAGIILFARNCASHDQIRALVSDAVRAIGSDDTLVLIDQEGGRVQRLRPPLGRALPPAAAYAALYDVDADLARRAAFDAARLVAADLRALGINTDCAPVLDVPVAGSHGIIGDRAYGDLPGKVADLGAAVAAGLMAGGVVPVIKHIPGHGRATTDSHLALPVVTEVRDVLSATDFAAFKPLAHMPAAMTAHVVFTAVDPAHPASTSPIVTKDVIRGEIGFDGLLMSDDLGMKALEGPMQARAADVIAAGSDVALHCSGDVAEMIEAADGVPVLSGRSHERFGSALHIVASSTPFDIAAAEASLASVIVGYMRPAEISVGLWTTSTHNCRQRPGGGPGLKARMDETASKSDDLHGAWSALDADLAPVASEALIVDVAGFEGPLDLLLALARTQKVDIARISITALVEQYIVYIAEAQRLKLEIAADYLVMAAWLAYLKSRLLLPKEKNETGVASAEELAQRLAFRLARLDAMRNAMAQLMTRKRLGRDVFARGMPETAKTVRETQWTAEVFDLLKAYADQRRRTIKIVHVVKARKVWSIKDARSQLEKLVGQSAGDWSQLDLFLEHYLPAGEEGRTAIASSFGATLEMAREGIVELRQEAPFAPIYMRRRDAGDASERVG